MSVNDQIAVLEATACLGDVPLSLIQPLMRVLQARRIPAQQSVYRPGEDADFIYFIGAGRLRKGGDADAKVMRRGQMVGWRSFFHQTRRDEALVAEKDTLLYALDRAGFEELCAAEPEFLRAVLRATTPTTTFSADLAPRDFAANSQIGLFVHSDLSTSFEPQLDTLCSDLRKVARVAKVDAAEFATISGLKDTWEDLNSSTAADVTDHLEHDNDLVFLIARGQDSETWQQKVAAQADLILLVLPETATDLPDWLLSYIKTRGVPVGIAFIAASAARPTSHPRALFDTVAPAWHYRLAMDDQVRWKSVIRMSLGRGVNLVLAGGGALGAIHCGLLKAMEEFNFPIDSIGGTSVGACIALGYGAGFTADEITEKCRWLFLDQKPFSRFTFPTYAFVYPRRFDQSLRTLAEGLYLEDAAMPVHATVTNLTNSVGEVVTRGPLWETMRMTGSIPGLFPPYIRDGYAYVDGAVVNNLPLNVAQDRFQGVSIGVTFTLPADGRLTATYADLPGTVRGFFRAIGLGGASDYPKLGATLANAMVLSSASALRDQVRLADHLFHPPVPVGMNLMSWNKFKDLYKVGYTYGQTALAELDAKGRLAELRLF